jgi:hypothetical protein
MNICKQNSFHLSKELYVRLVQYRGISWLKTNLQIVQYKRPHDGQCKLG